MPLGRSNFRLLFCLTVAIASLTGRRVFGLEHPGNVAGESYFMVVYGAEDGSENPLKTHCFATFIKLLKSADGQGPPGIELRHINWFTRLGHESGVPHGLLNDGLLERPEPGENRDTVSAFETAARHKLSVFKFGPYEIEKALYEHASRQIDLLEGRVAGSRILYKQIDYGLREGSKIVASNCIHAVSDVIREPTPLSTGLAAGRQAALLNVQHFKRWIKDPTKTHPEIWDVVWRALWRSRPAPEVKLVDCHLDRVQPVPNATVRTPATQRFERPRLLLQPRRASR
jgi:hypothetical protein